MKHRLFLLILLLLCSLQAMPAVFTVTSNANSGPGTLNEALTLAAANGDVTRDVINFNLPGTTIASRTITLLTQLPNVSSNVVIDGTTQPGAKLGKSDAGVILMADINYSFPGIIPAGLVIDGVNNVAVYGMCIKGFNAGLKKFDGMLFFTAVAIYESSDIIIGAPGKGNVFTENIYGIFGIRNLQSGPTYSTNIKISSNFLSYDESGTVSYNSGSSLFLNARHSLIGGPAPGEQNYIARAIELYGSDDDVINNSLLIDINGQNNSAAGSTRLRLQGSNFKIAYNSFCATLFSFISVSHFSFIGNRQSLLPGNSLLSISDSSSGVVGGDNVADMNFFTNDGGAISSLRSVNISLKKNSIRCSEVPYSISEKASVPDITISVNNDTEFSGTASPGSVIDIYNDNTDCQVCNPVQYLTSTTTDAAGNWKITGNLNGKKLVANATLNFSSSEFTQPVISTNINDRVITQPNCGKTNGSIALKNLKNVTTITWYNENNQPVGNGPTLNNRGPGTYHAICASGSCFAQTDNFTLVDETPVVSAAVIKKISAACNNSNGSITGIELLNTSTTPAVTWTNANGDIVGHQLNLIDQPSGDYMLKVNLADCTIPYGPVNIANEELIVDRPSAPAPQICNPGIATITVNNISEGATYRLYNEPNDATPIDEQTNGIFKVDVATSRSYYISRLVRGCESSRIKIDVVVILNKLDIANVITPNNDGRNDYWQIPGIEKYPGANIKIFNRYGQSVFESKGYDHPFNGIQNGQELPAGIYYYIIDIKSSCGILSGNLSIIR